MKRHRDLGQEPIFGLVLRLAIPTMLAQMVNVLYSIVDRMYIGNLAGIGDTALAGVGVCTPIITLMTSFSYMVGLGGSPLMSIRMGEGDRREAGKILFNCFITLTAMAVLLSVTVLFGREKLLFWFGASAATYPYAERYLTICAGGIFFALMATGMNSFLICQGFSGLGMGTVVLGAVLNIILDPILMYALGMGVAGAALATVLSQAASCLFVLVMLRRKTVPVPLRAHPISLPVILRVVAFGVTPFLTVALDSVLEIVLNTVLQRCGGPGEGDTLLTCASIVQSYMLLVVMPLEGLTLGSQPVVSFNLGAGKPERIRKAMKVIVGLCLAFCALAMVGTQLLSPYFVRLFTQNVQIAQRSVRYIRVFTLMILPLALQYPFVDESTALGRVGQALFCSLFRKGIYLVCLLFLPALFGAEAAFWAEPISDLLAGITTTVIFLRRFPGILRGLSISAPENSGGKMDNFEKND